MLGKIMLAILALALLGWAAPANAGVLIGSHAHVYGQALDQAQWGTMVTRQAEGDGPLDTGALFGQYPEPQFAGSTIYGEAHARANVDSQHLLQVQSAAYFDAQSSFLPRGMGLAQATWRDVAFTGGGSTPDFITLQFAVEGWFSNGGRGHSSSLVVNTSTQVDNGFDNYFTQHSVQIGTGGEISKSWDSFVLTDHAEGTYFEGRFHINAGFNPLLGGYDWGVRLQSRSDANFNFLQTGPSWSEVDAMNSISLQRVLDAQGNAIAVTFDSGLQLADTSAVPEPASLTLMGLGGLGMFGGWYRKWRKSTGAA